MSNNQNQQDATIVENQKLPTQERQYCWNCNSKISPRCGRRLSRHLARSVSVPPTRNVHQSVPFIRSKSMPYRERDIRKMPTNFENSSIKNSFSLSSLHPSTVNVEGSSQAAQRPYNSLTKKNKKNDTTNQDYWRGDSSYEFLSSLRTSYQYLMDNNLIESCREIGCDLLNSTSSIQDWNVERLNIYIKELEKSFCSGSSSKTNSSNLPENLISPKRLSLSEEVCRLNILRHIAQLSKRLPHCREPSLNQSRSSMYNAHYLEVKSNLITLDQWMVQMEVRLKPNYFRVNWNRREIRQKAEEHKSIHSDIETKGKCVRLVLKYCKWLADENQPPSSTNQELVQTVPLLTRKAKNFEHRWQLLYIRSLEWICFIESLTVKKCREDSHSSSDCDEEPVHKCPRLVDYKLSNSIDSKNSSCTMETETSPSPVLQSELVSAFDDTANFHRSVRKGPNSATFYYKHLDTDSEQESQKKSTAETEIKTSAESSEEEWTYSTNVTKEVKKPDMHVSLAERADIEEIKALVENVNWTVSKNKNPEKLWMTGNGVMKRRYYRHDNFDPENEGFIGDSCDASGEYTTEDDDQHFNSDNHSHSSRSCDITIIAAEPDFLSNPGHINDCSSPKVLLRSKTNSRNSLRPVSMSGLPQSTPKARLLTESCQLSVSESALNQISHEQVSVNGRDSSTIEESTATQTQDCCGPYNTNSLRRRKLKHRRRSTMEKKSKSGSADSLSSVVNSIANNEMVTSGSFSGSLCGIPQGNSERVDSETEEETTKDSKRPAARKRPIKMPVFRLGEFGAVTPREKRFPLTTQLPSGTTTDFSSFSEQAWDSYQEKYLSEPYSEDPPDPDSVRRLLEFGDDYRKYIDSQSDCASSIGRPSFLDDETFEQDSSDSVRKLIIRSRLQLNYLEQVLSKLLTNLNSNLTITEIGQLKQWCRENEYCLRFCLEGINDSNTYVSASDMAEIEKQLLVRRTAYCKITPHAKYCNNCSIHMDHKPPDSRSVDNHLGYDSDSQFFDLETQQLEADHYIFNTSSETDSSVFDCSLDESFQQIKNDLELLQVSSPSKMVCDSGGGGDGVFSNDEFPDIDINERFEIMIDRVRNYRSQETETLRKCIIELDNTVACITNNEAMLKKCERLEIDISRQEKIQLLKTDIAAIKSRLMSFSRNDRLDFNVQNKNELQALIHTAKTELSNLETYWDSRNIVTITEELNRHYNEMSDSNTLLNNMNKEVADLYSIYTNTRQRLESEISRYQSALITWAECDKQLMELEMKFKGFGDDGVSGNQKSRGFGSASDSGMSDSGSEHELNEHEKRLVNLKQLANDLMTIMTPGSEALSTILARIENNEKQLKELQQTCKDLMGRTEIQTDEDKLDGNKSIVETNMADETIEETKTPLKKIKENTALLWRTLRIAVPFYLAVVILCSIGWLEPQCCDLQNNYKWSFALGLRYMNGPPPT